MTNPSSPNLSPQLQRFGKLSDVARKMVDGPRSVVPENEGDQDIAWYDPVVKLTHQRGATRSVEGIILYRLCSELRTGDSNPLLIRHLFWDTHRDRQLCRTTDHLVPSVQLRYAMIPEMLHGATHTMLLALDRSLHAIPFEGKGLERNATASDVLSSGEGEVGDASHYELERVTCFQYLAFHWTPFAGSNPLDQAFREFFDYLKQCVANNEMQSKVKETYDVEPYVYGTIVE